MTDPTDDGTVEVSTETETGRRHSNVPQVAAFVDVETEPEVGLHGGTNVPSEAASD